MSKDIYRLPDLAYDYAALEPHYSARTLELHHSKHHATYVKQANETLDRIADRRGAAPDPLIARGLRKALAFNVSGHLLHSIFWTSMTPGGSELADGTLSAAIDADFGGMDNLKKEMGGAVAGLQGSGWAALSWEPLARRLLVEQIYDHQSNMTPGQLPLLVIDGWEHAYYLQYQNDKAAWVDAFWNVANWSPAQIRFDNAVASHLEPAFA